MNRTIAISVVVFATIFAGALFWLKSQEAAPSDDPPPVKPPTDAAKAENQNKKEEEKQKEEAKADEPPPLRKLPLVFKRWPMPSGQKAPDKEQGTSLFINPDGPWVINQSKTGANYWNASTGQSRRTARIPETEPMITTGLGPDGKLLSQVHDRRDNKKLLDLRETIARVACWTPDGRRLIVVLKPGMYPAYTTINVMTGETKERPPHPVKNLMLYDVASGDPLGEFSPKEHGLDDDIWAVAAASDGQSFFIASQKQLMQINFEKAFDRRPITPAR